MEKFINYLIKDNFKKLLVVKEVQDIVIEKRNFEIELAGKQIMRQSQQENKFRDRVSRKTRNQDLEAASKTRA